MIFNTYAFALFAAVFFPGYWFIRSPGLRAWWLLGGCAVFHGHFAGPAGVLPIAALALLTYACALSASARSATPPSPRASPPSFFTNTRTF
jgi:hypothetical protein